MRLRFYIGTITLMLCFQASTQSVKVGAELDILPYLTKGYFGAGWVGKENVRIRGLVAHVNMPDFIVPDGFSNNTITSLALVGDYFFKDDFSGFWMGAGPVIWNGQIQSELRQETASFRSYLFNGSLGYVFRLNRLLYFSPWVGMSLKVAGDENISVDGIEYHPPLLNPELSLKIGININ